MPFGEVLRELLELADIKQIQLAEHLDYDVSYINKWISGQKQPSVRNNRALFQNIAEFLLKHGGNRLRSALQTAEDWPEKLSDEEYILRIVERLSTVYGPSENKKPKNAILMGHNCFFGKMSTAYTLSNQRTLAAICGTAQSKKMKVLDFISIPPLDFCGYGEAKSDWQSKLAVLPQETQIHVRFAADFRQKDFWKALCRDIFVFLFGLPERAHFDIYQDDSFYSLKQGIYVCQDILSIQFFRSVLWQENSMIVNYDSLLVNDCYSAADHLLSKNKCLVHRESFQTLYAQKYFRSFLLSQSISAFHTVMPMLYMSEEQFATVCGRNGFSDSVIDMYRFYERVSSRCSLFLNEKICLQFDMTRIMSIVKSYVQTMKISWDALPLFLKISDNFQAIFLRQGRKPRTCYVNVCN